MDEWNKIKSSKKFKYIIQILILFLILVIIIVGNKNDIQTNGKVNEFEVKEFSNQNNVIFHLTSAANGNGINELFEKIGKYCLNKYDLNRKWAWFIYNYSEKII